MKNLDLKIDYKNKTFLYQGYFYGYVKDRTIFVFWSKGSDEIPIDRISRSVFFDCKIVDQRAHSIIDTRSILFCGARNSYELLTNDYCFYTDLYFNSEKHMEEFVKFIDWCYLN